MRCYPLDLAIRIEKFIAIASEKDFYKNAKDVETIIAEANQLFNILTHKPE